MAALIDQEPFMTFRITGLSPAPFKHLYGLSEEALASHGAERHIAHLTPGFPDRVELRDANPGETLLLLNFTHQGADNPYRASHAIFVLEGAETAYESIGKIPAVLRIRAISFRSFDNNDRLVDADLAQGMKQEKAIQRLLDNPQVSYIQAHYAKPGCYAARITRVQ